MNISGLGDGYDYRGLEAHMAPQRENGKRFGGDNAISRTSTKKYPAATGGGRDRASGLILSLLPGGDETGEAF
jgi:hypothetical protein